MRAANISAIILAGGRGRRMHNNDKGLIHWRGQTLVQRCIERIEPQVNEIVLSCNRNIKRYQRYGYPVIRDQTPGFLGPLSGVSSALRVCHAEVIFVCPCDCPLLPLDVVNRLWQSMVAHNVDVAIAHDGNRAQSLVMLFNTHRQSQLHAYLAAGGRSVQGWQQQQNSCYVDFSTQQSAFANVNSAAELQNLQ